jgi:organic radical activating enzyme
LISELRNHDYRIAVATSGAKPVSAPVDWLSVSPHTTGKLAQTFGHELKLVDGLHEILLESSDTAKLYLTDGLDFWFRYVQPLTRGDGSEDPESLARCMAFLRSHSGWALSRQDHRVWGVE